MHSDVKIGDQSQTAVLEFFRFVVQFPNLKSLSMDNTLTIFDRTILNQLSQAPFFNNLQLLSLLGCHSLDVDFLRTISNRSMAIKQLMIGTLYYILIILQVAKI